MKLDFTKEAEAAKRQRDDLVTNNIITECKGWVSNPNLETGYELADLTVKYRFPGDLVPNNGNHTFVDKYGYMYGDVYTLRGEAMKEALEYLEWLIPASISNIGNEENWPIGDLKRWAKQWHHIRNELGYTWNELGYTWNEYIEEDDE